MQGFPFAVLDNLRNATTKKLIVAGGITTQAEVDRLNSLGIDAVVGMAIYTGAMQL
jgi:phosphoribosylformimino-5-aminoimidazole carboxamide ribotide isomerase